MDLSLLKSWFDGLYPVGAGERGVTRLAYTEIEDEMHSTVSSFAARLGLESREDPFGNTFISFPDSPSGDKVLIGSHLDSVPEGGRYDGVAGVLAGLLVMARFKAEGGALPLETVAFRCEESSRFGLSTLASSLYAGTTEAKVLKEAVDKDGVSLYDAMHERGFSPDYKSSVSGVSTYLELHIEQGRVLEAAGRPLGIVTAIAAPVRFRIIFEGRADHSGATPMDLRQDALCAASEVVLAAEVVGNAGKPLGTVATVGVIQNEPNALNVIPGRTVLGVDVRGVHKESLLLAADKIRDEALAVGRRRAVAIRIEEVSSAFPVAMDEAVVAGLRAEAEKMGADYMVMASGAGHDAMNIAPFAPTGMVFIPCRDGISHNPAEQAEPEDVALGAGLLYNYIKGRYGR